MEKKTGNNIIRLGSICNINYIVIDNWNILYWSKATDVQQNISHKRRI